MPPRDNHKEKYDPELVINRLLEEQRITRETLNQIERTYREAPEFDGLSLIGGIKTIIKRFREEQEKVKKLEKEIFFLRKNKD